MAEATETSTETPTEQPSGLPSDAPADDAYDGFKLTDDIKAKFKDGKLNGRFSSMDDVLVKLKEAEDFRAATMSETAKADKGEVASQALADTQTSVINDIVPAFLENGMVLTPEMEAKALEAKIDIRDLKIGAMEMRDSINAAHEVVGGADEYQAMIAWGKENMSDSDKASFDKAVTGGMSKYAIKGLHAEFKKAEAENGGRIEGSSAFTGTKAYTNRQELYKDKDYIESKAGRRDTAAIKTYRARLAATHDDVVFGRR